MLGEEVEEADDDDDDDIDDAADDSNGGAEVELEVATVEPAYLCRGFSTDVQVGLANVPPLLLLPLPVLLMFAAAAATVGDCGAREIVCKYETAVATAAAAAAADALPLPPLPLLDCVLR